MEARAVLRYARISPRKVKIVLDLIRNKPANVAMGILNNTPKAASEYLTKLLASAIANAENNHDMDKNKLYVAECYATQGPTLKRIQPHAQGRAFKILNQPYHFSIKGNGRLIEKEVHSWDKKLIHTDLESEL